MAASKKILVTLVSALALGALVVTSLIVMILKEFVSMDNVAVYTITLLAGNLALLWLVFEIIRRSAREARLATEGGHTEHDEHAEPEHAPAQVTH